MSATTYTRAQQTASLRQLVAEFADCYVPEPDDESETALRDLKTIHDLSEAVMLLAKDLRPKDMN